jgi:hypothetical protein
MLIIQVKLINMRRFAFYSKHVKISKQYWLTSHDYSVVINPYSSHHNIMKLIILRLDAANKYHSFPRVSQRFESIVNLAREITWQHDTHGPRRHHEWQQFTTTIKESSRTHLTLVHVFHAYASADTPWVSHALSHVSLMRYGRVSSNSATVKASRFAGPKKSRMRQYTTQSLFIRTQPTWGLIDTGGGYHLGPPNIRSDHSHSFPSSILHFPLIAPPGLQLCQYFHKYT